MAHINPNIVWMASLLVASLIPHESAAFLFSSTTTNTVIDTTKTAKHMADCIQFKLKEIQGGATDTTRTYWFNGICKIWVVKYVGGKEQGTSGEASFWAEAKVTWNAQSSALEELVKLTDPGNKHSGTLRSNFKCMQDPVVQKANCVRLSFQNLTDWTGFSVPADKNRPMLENHVTMAQVAEMTKSGTQSTGTAGAPGSAPKPSLGSAPAAPTSRGIGPRQAAGSTTGALAPQPMLRQPSDARSETRQRTILPAVQQPSPARAIAPPIRSGARPDPTRAATERELAAAGCARVRGAPPASLSLSCTGQAGLERCEALRAQRKVDQCALNARR